MQTRRSIVAASAAALALAPQYARAQGEPNAMQLFYRQGRYLPYWRELQQQGGALAEYFAAFLGDEAHALGGLEPPEPTESLAPDAHARDAVRFLVGPPLVAGLSS
jgi:hypothetical protein